MALGGYWSYAHSLLEQPKTSEGIVGIVGIEGIGGIVEMRSEHELGGGHARKNYFSRRAELPRFWSILVWRPIVLRGCDD